MSNNTLFNNSRLAIKFPTSEEEVQREGSNEGAESLPGACPVPAEQIIVDETLVSNSINDERDKNLEGEENPDDSKGSVPGEKIHLSLHDMAAVNIDDAPAVVDVIQIEISERGRSADMQSNYPTFNSNNNCMSLVPISATNQALPLALVGKPSNSVDECPGGIMQLITGKNNHRQVAPESSTIGTVIMVLQKKSDSVCVDMPQDQENNPTTESNQADQQTANNAGGTLCQSDEAIVKPAPSYDSYEEVCRICHDNPSKLELISPCLCKGSMSKVHRTCLERWLGESAKNSCEICGYEYNTVRKPKYTGCRSVFEWIRHPLQASDTRNLFFDIACFFILTPLAAISSWLCVVGAQHYSFGDEHKRKIKLQDTLPHGRSSIRDASNATWTSVGLLSLTGTLLAAYYIWLFVAIRYHIQVWREWQQRNFIVNIVPFEDGCMGRPPPPRPPRTQTTNNNSGGSESQNYDASVNYSRYSHNSVSRGRSVRQNRYSANNNMPAIFSRSHFIRHPPPGYTISETALLYQAVYGSDSDTALLNENLLAFIAESSDDVQDTESSSIMVAETVTEMAAEYQNRNPELASHNTEGSVNEVSNHVSIPIELPSSCNDNLKENAERAPEVSSKDATNENAVLQEASQNHESITIHHDDENQNEPETV